MTLARHLLSILLLPGTATIAVPVLILRQSVPAHPGWGLPFPVSLLPLLFGFILILAGLVLMAQTIALFARLGRGTLAPWDAPVNLVVEGVYRHVRNPMISAVFFILLGEAIVFGSMQLLIWFGLFVLVNLIYMPLLEEPALRRRFGQPYEQFQQNVPRWIPRRTPWKPESL